MKLKKMSVLAALMAMTALASCNGNNNSNSVSSSGDHAANNPVLTDGKTYTLKDYTAVSPSNWNELTYEDNNDTQIMSYIGSSFFTFDYLLDDSGNPVDGKFTIKYDAATKLEDVTTTYAGNVKYAVPAGATSGYAYKITLRDDLKWDDGTPIHAKDFVYTMKQQLDPDFKNYRADSFYAGATVIHNAEAYVKQGSLTFADNFDANTGEFTIEMTDLTKGSDGVYSYEGDVFNGTIAKFAIGAKSNWCSGRSLAAYSAYLDQEAIAALIEMMDDDGYVDITDETIALLTKAISTEDWEEDETCLPAYIQVKVAWADVNFDDVGIFVGNNENELVVVLDSLLDLLAEDGSLTYKAAYNFSSLPLVHEQKYEDSKKAPTLGSNLYTSIYNSSVATSASWGPYKLTEFQAGKHYKLERNLNWYGYNTELYWNQYQTDIIDVETIAEWNTAWLKFQSGELNSIGIDVSISSQYKGSSQAIYTPSDYVGSLQLQSSKEALKNRERDGVNKTILAYTDFRKAISLSIDRTAYNTACTTSSQAGFGLFNSMHYYDVANGGVYRNTDYAKEILLKTYGVNKEDYGGDLDRAYAAITGFDLPQAKKLVNKAYNEALAAGDIKSTDKVVLTFGTSVRNEAVERQFNFLSDSLKEMVKGTELEGRLETELVEKLSEWATSFRKGEYDICTGGWTGAAWDPGYFLTAYLSPQNMYSQAWDTSSVMMTHTMKGAGANGEDITDTMSLMDWYNCLNGNPGAKYNWAENHVNTEARLSLIAALEGEILTAYYTVPISYQFSASLLSYQVEYYSRDYNTFMGYGGVRYMTYNYDDAEWAAYLANHTLDYTK